MQRRGMLPLRESSGDGMTPHADDTRLSSLFATRARQREVVIVRCICGHDVYVKAGEEKTCPCHRHITTTEDGLCAYCDGNAAEILNGD